MQLVEPLYLAITDYELRSVSPVSAIRIERILVTNLSFSVHLDTRVIVVNSLTFNSFHKLRWLF